MVRGATKLLFAFGAIALSATACAAVLGIEDGIVDPALSEAGANDGGGPGDGAPGDTLDEPPFTPCTDDASSAAPNDALGVFVVQGASEISNCGTRAQPCPSIASGLSRAGVTGAKFVYVAAARDPYAESISLVKDVTVEGGWVAKGQDWLPSCASDASSVVVLQPKDQNTTVVARDLGGAATLHHLTIKSPEPAPAGQTVYGVQALGATTTLVLDDVVVALGSGGDGTNGTPGALGAAAGNGCSVDSGAPATQQGTFGASADGGIFSDAGYVPGSGATGGGPGAMGFNGRYGSDGGCVDCVVATSCNGTLNLCSSSPSTPSCGTPGTPGCGGGPGQGGGPGGSGGSSVGLFVWDAKVSVVGGAVHAGNGGAGGAGGPGGDGGAGGNGGAGQAGPQCAVGCAGATCSPVNGNGPPGGQGVAGGQDSAGGNGGAGSGGWSVAYVQGGTANVAFDGGTDVKPGQAGTSRGNGASGQSLTRWP